MTREQLLIPRAICLGKKPGTPLWPTCTHHKVGDILWMLDKYVYSNLNGGKLHQSLIQDYPNLFKYLEWWEHRTPEQMPRYISQSGFIGKASKWKMYSFGWCFQFEGVGGVHFLSNMFPATEDEYNEYKKSANEKNKPAYLEAAKRRSPDAASGER